MRYRYNNIKEHLYNMQLTSFLHEQRLFHLADQMATPKTTTTTEISTKQIKSETIMDIVKV